MLRLRPYAALTPPASATLTCAPSRCASFAWCPLHPAQDGTSFLNIPYYSDAYTELATVSIMTGPCIIPQERLSQQLGGVLAFMADVPGCNVRSCDNTSLIPLLMRDATVNTTQPLLVQLVSNVTLGPNLPRPIVFARPVVIVGAPPWCQWT